MKSGYYIHNNEKYIFELENQYMTVVNEKGQDFKKFIDNLNGKFKEENEIQILKVKMFPNWNDAIIFHKENLDSIDGVHTFKILGIIEFKFEETNIDAINIYAKELDYIYNSSKIIDNIDYTENGKYDLSIKSFDDTDSIKKKVQINQKTIAYSFNINRKVLVNDINNCFDANTILKYRCDNLSYQLIYEIIWKTYLFIAYLCYRQNVSLKNIELLKKDENGKYCKTAQMTFFNNEQLIEVEDKYLKDYYIEYDYINSIDDKILQAIIDNDIFIRHIPKNHIERNRITPQSFVIASSAFEWEFNKLFPEGVKHSQSKINNISEIKSDLQNLSEEYNAKKKKIIKDTIDNIGKDNLESKLIFANNELKETSEIFLERLCDLNNIDDTNKVFTDLQKLRNDFAHGNMDIDLNSDGFTGIIYLERLVYIMQMKRFGLDDDKINKAIRKLFG